MAGPDEPPNPLPSGIPRVAVRSVCLGAALDTRQLKRSSFVAASPLTTSIGDDGCAVLFRFGAVVFFNAPAPEQARFLAEIAPLVTRRLDQPISEEVELRVSPDSPEIIGTDAILVPDLSLRVLQIVAEGLAKSTVLEHYEQVVSSRFDQVSPLSESLENGTFRRAGSRLLLGQLGAVLRDQQDMLGRLEIIEKPDLLWDHPELERLYARLIEDLEIVERHSAVERKLGIVERTIDTAFNALQARRSLRVEWYIVILIVVEILLTLYEMFIRH